MSGGLRIEVAIDELVLHGFDPRHRAQIAEAVATELAASIQGWRPRAGLTAARLDGGSFDVPGGAPPAAVGRSVARQVRQVLPGAAPDTTGGRH